MVMVLSACGTSCQSMRRRSTRSSLHRGSAKYASIREYSPPTYRQQRGALGFSESLRLYQRRQFGRSEDCNDRSRKNPAGSRRRSNVLPCAAQFTRASLPTPDSQEVKIEEFGAGLCRASFFRSNHAGKGRPQAGGAESVGPQPGL